MKKIIYLLFFLNTILTHSQSICQGEIFSFESTNIPYAKIVLKGTNYGTYSDGVGKFELKNIKKTDTLHISAFGYYDTLITNFSLETPLKIYLEKEISETLDELIITTYNSEEQYWLNFFGNKSRKFRNKFYRNKYYNAQTLYKGNVNINQFVAVDTLKIKGFSVYTVNGNIEQNVVLQPIVVRGKLDIDENLVKDAIKTFSTGKGRKGKLVPLDFSFENVVTFYPEELVYLGIELIDSDYSFSDGTFFLPIICYNKETIPMSSFRTKSISDEITEQYHSKTFLERPFYFELKVVVK